MMKISYNCKEFFFFLEAKEYWANTVLNVHIMTDIGIK